MPGPYAWTPRPEDRERSNVARFMRRHGIADLDELIRRSTEDIAWFWFAVVEDLGLQFFEPYKKVVEDADGPAWARWFVGGTLNAAHNCVDRWAGDGAEHGGTALIWEGEDGEVRRMTYPELREASSRLGNLLKHLGVGRGDRVGLFLPMVPEAAVALFAVARIGAVAVPIFSGFGAEAVAIRLQDAGAKILLTSDGFRRKGKVIPMGEVAAEAAGRSASIERTVVFRRFGTELRPGQLDWEEGTRGMSPDCPAVPMDSEAPFLIVYTSGTTGRPKGAVHVHGGFLVKIAQEVAHQTDMTAADVLCWFTDLGWIMGPWELVGGLASGGAVLLYEGAPDVPGPDRVWDLVERHGVTILGISPTLIRALMRHGDGPVARHDLSRLRILASTGEPWNADPWRWYFEKVGGGRCPVINISGGTEVGACFLSPLPLSPLKPCTLGGPSLGMAVDVVDPEGRPIRDGVGELICRKPWPGMTRGLWNDPDRYIQTYWSRFPGVWTHGDWASIDEDGLWFLHGRSDDTLNVAGKRIGPAEVESALVSHDAVAEAAAVGVPHDIKGEAIWAFVVPRDPDAVDDRLAASLRDHAGEALGKSFAPDRVLFVRELPKTRNAKVLRRAIRARAIGLDPGDLSSLENPAALEEIEAAARPVATDAAPN
jgi:acetyl-CoA synthetase